ncbi:site-specific integrase [Amycolatopsis sp. H20-H5]|uniref:site-specific integrase n=1 Tax=Amycolatopsis sp. H20-H5 TaxID=3046309 RepID=UPI002DBA645F|nr:tyrosine-type recombinase/integrase [Amycolatopsis sp. H20-H5]MEC3975945.1 tyrosine-type recombinase/integrase [Amycolatopsis sp. H20-H5]
MGRPPLEIGTYGKIRTNSTATGVRARASYRGHDGKVRDIERTARSKTAAERDLKAAIAQELQTPGGTDVTAKSKFADVAALWMAEKRRQLKDEELASGTVGNYASMLRNHVLPAFGELRLFEVSVSRLDRFFPALKAKSSAAHARTARAVVSGVLRYAARHDAIKGNPVREIEPIRGGARKKPRGLNEEERAAWLAQLEADPEACRHDLPDLTRFMLATGTRIGEALALYWEDVDLDAGTVLLEWTVVRIKGEGLVRTKPKTDASKRTLRLPAWALILLHRRHTVAVAENRASAHPVFPDSLGGLRDPSNTRRNLRDARGSDQFAWVISHAYRKTNATMLDEAKLTPRAIADQLGHAKPSMTQNVYMARGVPSSEAAEALHAAWPEES